MLWFPKAHKCGKSFRKTQTDRIFCKSQPPPPPLPKSEANILGEQGANIFWEQGPSDSSFSRKSVLPTPWEPHSCVRLTELVCRAKFSLGDLPICSNGGQIPFLGCQICRIQDGGFPKVMCLQTRHLLCLQTRHLLCQQTRHLSSPKTYPCIVNTGGRLRRPPVLSIEKGCVGRPQMSWLLTQQMSCLLTQQVCLLQTQDTDFGVEKGHMF